MIATKPFDVSRCDARKEYLKYLAACKANPSADLELIKRVYRELSLDHRVINVNDAIENAGRDAEGLPRLAVARADQEWCRLSRYYVNSKIGNQWLFFNTTNRGKIYFRYPVPESVRPRDSNLNRRAMVPLIPPNVRPEGHLSKYWILFEAEWKPVPPVDPILLRRVGGPFFVVLAHWDLTDVERSVLGAFRREEV